MERPGGARLSRAFLFVLLAALGGAFGCAGKSLRSGENRAGPARGGASGDGSGASGSGGGPGATGGAGAGGVELCVAGQWESRFERMAVMLVVERAESMRMELDAGRSRWEAARAALLDPTVGALVPGAQTIDFGLMVFGTPAEPTAESCLVESGSLLPAANDLDAIRAAYPSELPEPGLGAAVGAAVEVASERLLALDPERYTKKAIVLVIDGVGGTCTSPLDWAGGESDAFRLVTYAWQAGVTTYVVDAGGGEAIGPLQRVARAGQGYAGTDLPDFTLSVLRPDELRSFFDPGAVDISCSLPLAARVADGAEALGRLTFDGDVRPHGDWSLRDGVTLDLAPWACEGLMAPGDHSLIAEFPCDALDPL